MAPIRAVYSGSAAEFVIAQGAEADILDELGGVIGTGAAAMLPLTASVYNVRKNDRATPVTDLLDYTGAVITQVTSVTSPYEERARLLWFKGPSVEIPETLWLTPASGDLADVVFYALHPHVEHVVNYVDGAVGRASIDDLSDVDLSGAVDGELLSIVGGIIGTTAPSGGGGSIASVNGDTGPDVDLTPAEIGAAPAVHSHAQSEITGLVAALATFALTGHQHDASAIITGILALARMPPGTVFSVKESAPGSGVYTRSTTRADMLALFLGEEDPGPEALQNDVWLRKIVV